MADDPKQPWHKRYHGNALGGYVGLSLELRGAYTTILDLLYDSGWEEGLADRDRWFAGHMDISVRKWKTIRDDLLAAGKIDILPDGRVSNLRYRIEREKALTLSRKRAESGASGGEKSGVARRKKPDLLDLIEANASNLPLHTRAKEEEEEEERENPPIPIPSKSAPREIGSEIDRLAARAGVASGIEVGSHRTDYGGALDQVREWLQLGLDPDTEIIPAIRQDAADHPGEKRFGLKYFTPIMRRIAANKEAKANGHRKSSSRGTRAVGDFADPLLRGLAARMDNSGDH